MLVCTIRNHSSPRRVASGLPSVGCVGSMPHLSCYNQRFSLSVKPSVQWLQYNAVAFVAPAYEVADQDLPQSTQEVTR